MASPQSISLRNAIEQKRSEKMIQYAVKERLGLFVYEDGQLKDFIEKWLQDFGNIGQALQYVADKYDEDFGHDKGKAEEKLRQIAHRLFVDDPNTPQNEGWNSNNWGDLSEDFLKNSKPIMLKDLRKTMGRQILLDGEINAIEGEIQTLVAAQNNIQEADAEEATDG
jgi:hypothetical protein